MNDGEGKKCSHLHFSIKPLPTKNTCTAVCSISDGTVPGGGGGGGGVLPYMRYIGMCHPKGMVL